MAGSSAAVSAGLFVSGLAVGATGAALFRRRQPEPLAIAEPSSVAPPQDSGAVRARGEHFIIGNYPGPVADFLQHVSYISTYDRARQHPHWTAEHLTASNLQAPSDGKPRGDRRNSVFKEDERIPELFRSRNVDYFRSGYDRGHMVPAADCKVSQQSMDETFYLSNIAPQVGEGFNRDYWAHVEDFVRRMTSRFADLYVFTIPLYLPRQGGDGKWRVSYEVIGDPPRVSVPTHFAKVIYGVGRPDEGTSSVNPSARSIPAQDDGQKSLPSLTAVGLRSGQDYTALGAFVLPNAVIPNDAPLRNFTVPVDAVERAAGLQLFSAALKSRARILCDTVDCNIIVRDFGDRNNQQRRSSTPTAGAPAGRAPLPQPSIAALPGNAR